MVGFNTAESWSEDIGPSRALECAGAAKCSSVRCRISSIARVLSRYPAALAGLPGLDMEFQQKKPSAIGRKALLPGFIEPELARLDYQGCA